MKRIIILGIYFIFFWIILPFILIATSLFLDNRLSFIRAPSGLMIAGGTFILSFAVPLLFISVYQFKKYGDRWPVSAIPPVKIIQKGIFAIWRHPIYLFFTITFAGISLLSGSKSMLLITIPVFICLEAIYILNEEKILIKRFGELYINYKKKTPLVIPGFYQLLKIPGFILCKYFFSYQVLNKKNIPDSPPFFIISSHRNYLDPLFISLAIPFHINFITTFEVFRNPLPRFIFKKFLCIPKKRYIHDMAAGRLIIKWLNKDSVIGVFPEGERSWTGIMNSFKPETINLFKKFHHIPILPVKLEGNFHAWPRWSNKFRKAKVVVTIQKPVKIDMQMDYQEIERQLMSLISPDDNKNPELFCRSKKWIQDLTRVLYRCPECHGFDCLKISGDNDLNCEICQNKLIIDSYYAIHTLTEGKKHSFSLDELYKKIKITKDDIFAIPEFKVPPEKRIYQEKDELIISFTDGCILYKEVKNNLEVIFRGEMILTTKKLIFSHDENTVEIKLAEISSVTIESNYKLQMYDIKNKQLYQITWPGESALKWQDYIVATILKEMNNLPNTR